MIGESIEKAESVLAAKRKEEGVLQRRADELKAQAKEAAGRAKAWQSKLRSLRLHVIEEDEEEGNVEPSSGEPSQQLTDVDSPQETVESIISRDGMSQKLPVYTEKQLAGKRF